MKILIVEDDIHLAEALEHIIKEQKYFVDVVHDGEEGVYYASNNEYDVIILDIMLPKKDGYEVVKELRKQKISTPILLLTAKNETYDKVIGLDSGADDYMIKPFETQELLARVRALSRRLGEVVVDEMAYEDLKLNLNTNEISCDKKTISLSNKEFKIMQILMTNPSMIVSKEELIQKVWGYDSDAEDNNVEAFISFLRKKMNYIKTKVVITTIRKVGYKLEAKESDKKA